MVGEIWLHGDNIAAGYWRKPQQTQKAFGGQLVDPSSGTPLGPWLRTGDLGTIHEGELYIIGRIKDLLIVDGRNHYPDDIEATTQEISGGRVAAISIEDGRTERLIVIAEMKDKGNTQEMADRLRDVRAKSRLPFRSPTGCEWPTWYWFRPGRSRSRPVGRSAVRRVLRSTSRMTSAVWIPPLSGIHAALHRSGGKASVFLQIFDARCTGGVRSATAEWR